jgi:hypothetical protein
MSERLIELILEVRDEMDRLGIKTENNNIKIINTFLMRYCTHEIVSDDIDITPDTSTKIRYCNKCGITFL